MNRRVRLHEDAYHDLDSISAYIGADSPCASVRFLEAAQRTFEEIAERPGFGALRDYGNPALIGLRVRLVPKFPHYGIYYLTTSETVEILRVLHGAQDLDAIFAPSEE